MRYRLRSKFSASSCIIDSTRLAAGQAVYRDEREQLADQQTKSIVRKSRAVDPIRGAHLFLDVLDASGTTVDRIHHTFPTNCRTYGGR